jgi:ribosome-binding factor A
MLGGKRAVRVGDQILRWISVLLLERVKEPRVKGVTLTGIRLSEDLKQARIYYSLLGDVDVIKRAQAGLDSAKGFIKKEIGRGLGLRYVPDIQFIHDPSLEIGSHLESLFEKIRREEMRRTDDKVKSD